MTIKMTSDIIKEGMTLALRKSEEYLSDAELLISKGSLNTAVVLIEFAIEEFGRAVALCEKLKTGSVEVERTLLKSHNLKYNKAWSVLPEDLKTIYEGTFDPAIFDPNIFDVGKETISPRTRLDATFVDYDESIKKWKDGIRADKYKLEAIIKGIREEIRSFSC
jgi:AbiV family abortive infection protein